MRISSFVRSRAVPEMHRLSLELRRHTDAYQTAHVTKPRIEYPSANGSLEKCSPKGACGALKFALHAKTEVRNRSGLAWPGTPKEHQIAEVTGPESLGR